MSQKKKTHAPGICKKGLYAATEHLQELAVQEPPLPFFGFVAGASVAGPKVK